MRKLGPFKCKNCFYILIIAFVFFECSSDNSEKIPAEYKSDLLEIWGTSDTSLIAVGQAGIILYYNGNSWEKQNSGTTNILFDVAGSSIQNVFAVGMDKTLLHYNGKEWSNSDFGLNVTLSGICAIEKDIYAVGGGGTIIHYDGKSWENMNSGISSALSDISGSSPNNIFAVGRKGLILYYNGKSWTQMESPVKTNLLSVYVKSENEAYAVGLSGVVLSFNGVDWKVIMKKDSGSRWNGVYAPGNLVWVVGYDSRTGGIAMSYDGKEWVDARTSPSVGLWSEINSVWGFSPSNFYMVGLDGINHW